MEDYWANLTTDKIWIWWNKLNWAAGLMEQGIMSNKPLYDFVVNTKKKIGDIKKRGIVSAVDINTGVTVSIPLMGEGLSD